MVKLVLAAIFIFGGLLALYGLRRMANRMAGGGPQSPRAQSDARTYRLAGTFGGSACMIVGFAIIVFSTFVVISTGHVGVVTVFSKVEPTPLYEGFNLVAPWKAVSQMSLQIQKKSDKFSAGSKDSQPVFVVMTINYRLKTSAAPEIFRTVGYDYANTIIAPAEQEVLKAHTALYPASEVLKERPKLKAEVQEDLGRWLIKYGIELKEVSLADIDFEKDYKDAIGRKQVEEQKAEQKRYELVQAQRQAEIAQARGKR